MQTIDGIPSHELHNLWIIEDDKVIQYEAQAKFNKILEIRGNADKGYSTEVAATLALIEQVKIKLQRLDDEKLRLTRILFNLNSSECLNINKGGTSTKKAERIGGIKIS